jgi:hypothetical protein
MFLAAKYEEIYPFKMRHVYEKIGHRKLSKKKVKDQEAEICHQLDFNLSAVTSYDFAMNALSVINVEKTLSRKDMKYLIKCIIYLSKMNIYDYGLCKDTLKVYLGSATFWVALKIMEQSYPRLLTSKYIDRVVDKYSLNKSLLKQTAESILNLAKNFESKYPKYTNLATFHSLSIPNKSGIKF